MEELSADELRALLKEAHGRIEELEEAQGVVQGTSELEAALEAEKASSEEHTRDIQPLCC